MSRRVVGVAVVVLAVAAGGVLLVGGLDPGTALGAQSSDAPSRDGQSDGTTFATSQGTPTVTSDGATSATNDGTPTDETPTDATTDRTPPGDDANGNAAAPDATTTTPTATSTPTPPPAGATTETTATATGTTTTTTTTQAATATTTTETTPNYDFTIETVEECGTTCRDVTARLANADAEKRTGVRVTTRVYADGDLLWTGNETVGALVPGEAHRSTKRVELGFAGAMAIQNNGGYVTIVTVVASDDGTTRFSERRKVA